MYLERAMTQPGGLCANCCNVVLVACDGCGRCRNCPHEQTCRMRRPAAHGREVPRNPFGSELRVGGDEEC